MLNLKRLLTVESITKKQSEMLLTMIIMGVGIVALQAVLSLFDIPAEYAEAISEALVEATE